METSWIIKDPCKDIGRTIYDDFLPVTPHSIISKRKYREIEEYHPKIIEFHNSLFDAKFSKPKKMRFGRKWRHINETIYFGLPKGKDEALYALSHEEGHRFYYKVNGFSGDEMYTDDNIRVVAHAISEGVAFYASGKFMGEIGFEEISKGLEIWAQRFGSNSNSLPNNLPQPVDITKLLYSKGEKFFKEFVRLDPLKAVTILNPKFEIEDDMSYVNRYPSTEELVSYASKYSLLHEKNKV